MFPPTALCAQAFKGKSSGDSVSPLCLNFFFVSHCAPAPLPKPHSILASENLNLGVLLAVSESKGENLPDTNNEHIVALYEKQCSLSSKQP